MNRHMTDFSAEMIWIKAKENIIYVKDKSQEICEVKTPLQSMIFFYLKKKRNVTKEYLNQQIVTSLAQHIER